MKGRAISYSPEELAWIEARKEMPRRAMHAEFCARFRRDDVSLIHINALCKRKGWLTGRTGQFHADQVPHNKGKKMPSHPNSARHLFQKGHRPHTYRGAGHERVDRQGYVIMIVDEVNPWTGAATRQVQKHRWLWEKANGPVPDGHALKCLDGDRTNTDPSNWEAIPRAVLLRLNGAARRLKYDEAAPEIKPTLMTIAKVEHAAREKRKEQE